MTRHIIVSPGVAPRAVGEGVGRLVGAGVAPLTVGAGVGAGERCAVVVGLGVG